MEQNIKLKIRSLIPSDDRRSFSCGEPALDRFFQYYAGQNQFKLKLAVTYVAILNKRIVGFATIVLGDLEKRKLPNAKMRQRVPSYSLPILRLARLGVDQRVQRIGIGHQLLKHIFIIALKLRDIAGCVGIVTDAKMNAVAFYKNLGFTFIEGVREGKLTGDSTPMFLDIHTIAATIKA